MARAKQVFGETAVIESGMSRLRWLMNKHGISSPEVLDGCIRWGSILDDLRAERVTKDVPRPTGPGRTQAESRTA